MSRLIEIVTNNSLALSLVCTVMKAMKLTQIAALGRYIENDLVGLVFAFIKNFLAQYSIAPVSILFV